MTRGPQPLRTPAAVSQHGYRSPLGPVPTNFVPPGLGPPRAPGAGQRHFRGRLSPARQPINGQSALRSEVNRGSNVALRFDLADHAGGRAPDVGIDHAAGVVGGIRGGRHRAGQLVQVDQSGGSPPSPTSSPATAAVKYTGPVSAASTRRSADQARDSPASAIIGACTRASSSRAVSAFCRAHANSARSCSAVRSGVRVRSSVNGRYPMGRGRRARERAPGWWLCSFAPRQHGIEGVGSASPPPGGRSRSTSAGSPAGSRRGVAPPVTGPELRRIRALLRRQRLAPLRGGEVLRSAGALVGALRGAGGSNRSSCTGGAVMVATSSSTGGKFQPRSAASIGHRAASRGVSVRPPVPHVGGHYPMGRVGGGVGAGARVPGPRAAGRRTGTVAHGASPPAAAGRRRTVGAGSHRRAHVSSAAGAQAAGPRHRRGSSLRVTIRRRPPRRSPRRADCTCRYG